jgi:membrane-associated protein
MQEIISAFLSHDLKTFIESIGLIGVYLVVFAESGLLVGFFLPGDSLLFTAGLLASPAFGFFNIWALVIGCWIAAIAGDSVGYMFGKKVGPALFKREHSLLFHPENLLKAQKFYEKHGGKAIVLARFMPVIRTFAPIVAGIGSMDYSRFVFFNFLGGTIWVWGMAFFGYFLGSVIPDADRYILPIVLVIVVLSVLPPLVHLYQERKNLRLEKQAKVSE